MSRETSTRGDRSRATRPGSTGVERRRFLQATGAASVAGIAGLAGCIGGGETITFGAPYILSGFASLYGEEAERGIEMAVEEINDDGGIDGSEIEVLTRDTEAAPETAIRQTRSLVEEENVDALFGLDSSGVGLAVAPVMEELQTPLVITHAATPFITAPSDVHDRAAGNEYVHRISANLAQNVHGAAALAGELDAESWTTIGPDYAFGHDTWDYFVGFTEGMDLGLEYLEDGVTFPALASDDYTPHIERVLDAEPDAVLASLWGSDLVTFVNQAQDAGFFDQIDEFLVSVGMGTELPSADRALPEGVWASTRYWPFAPDSEANNTFREAYVERYGTLPTYNAEGAYRALHVYKEVIESAGSTETDAILEELAGLQHEGPVGSYEVAAETGQAVLPSIWGRTAASDEYDSLVYDETRRIDAPPSDMESLLEGTDLPSGV